jgi:hypothetical protein
MTHQREHKRLGNAHDREFVVGVASRMDISVDAGNAHTKQFARYAGKRGINLRVLAVSI